MMIMVMMMVMLIVMVMMIVQCDDNEYIYDTDDNELTSVKF